MAQVKAVDGVSLEVRRGQTLGCSLPVMGGMESDTRRTALDVFESASMLILRLSLQAFPVFLTIAVAQIIARHF